MRIRLSKADKLWSRIVRERDGECRYCSKRPPYVLQAHHIMPRGRKSTRLLLENGVTLCFSHHVGTDNSAHRNPTFIKDLVGTKEYKRLEKLSLILKTERQAVKEFLENYPQ